MWVCLSLVAMSSSLVALEMEIVFVETEIVSEGYVFVVMDCAGVSVMGVAGGERVCCGAFSGVSRFFAVETDFVCGARDCVAGETDCAASLTGCGRAGTVSGDGMEIGSCGDEGYGTAGGETYSSDAETWRETIGGSKTISHGKRVIIMTNCNINERATAQAIMEQQQ